MIDKYLEKVQLYSVGSWTTYAGRFGPVTYWPMRGSRSRMDNILVSTAGYKLRGITGIKTHRGKEV